MAATYSLLSKALHHSSTNLSRVDWQPMPCLKSRKGLKKFSKWALSWRFMDFSVYLDFTEFLPAKRLYQFKHGVLFRYFLWCHDYNKFKVCVCSAFFCMFPDRWRKVITTKGLFAKNNPYEMRISGFLNRNIGASSASCQTNCVSAFRHSNG